MSTPTALAPKRYTVRVRGSGESATVTPVRSAMGDQHGAAVVFSCTGMPEHRGGLAIQETGGPLFVYVNAHVSRGRREQLVSLAMAELAGPQAVLARGFTVAVADMPEGWARPKAGGQ